MRSRFNDQLRFCCCLSTSLLFGSLLFLLLLLRILFWFFVSNVDPGNGFIVVRIIHTLIFTTVRYMCNVQHNPIHIGKDHIDLKQV